MTTRVYACVYIPELPAQTLVRLRPELRGQPVAVLEGERPFERICSMNAQARVMGMELGMTRAEAENFTITLLRRSVKAETSVRAALLTCLAAFTPWIEDQGTDTASVHVLDLSGTEKLLGSLPDATAAIQRHLADLGFSARIATGGNVHALLSIARSGTRQTVHIAHGAESQVLARLPLSALQLAGQHMETFAAWGLKSLGEVAYLPEVELIARLGQEGRRIRQLARGELPHLFEPILVPFVLEEFMEFDDPVESLESMLFVLNPMLEQLMLRASAHTLALATVTVACSLEGAPPHQRTLRPALPTQDRATLLKLLQLDLEAHPPEAGILAIRLTADPGPTSKVQLGLFSPQLPESMRLEVTLARIAAIVGEGRVGKAVLDDTHRTDAFHVQRFTVAAGKTAPATGSHAPALRRFRPTLPLRVEFAGRRLTALWHQEIRYRIYRMYGPWHTSGEWWSTELWSGESWDFVAHTPEQDKAILIGMLLYDRLRQTWQLEALYD